MSEPTGWSLLIQPDAQAVPIAEGQRVLDAILAAGVPWPKSCRNGTCRTCMGHLEAGTIRYLIDWPGLSPEEKEWGCALPCVAVACSDLTLVRVG